MGNAMSLKRAVPLAIALIVVAAAAFGAWTAFLRPVKVEVASIVRDVPVRFSALEPSRRGSRPRSASKFPAC